MAEEIVLSLKIDGADKAITSIDQLEREVAQLEETMRTADFGSKAFQDAEKELKAANAELYKFDRQLEAIQDPVKAQEKWVKYGEGVAGAFAAAQGAAAIFGVESENVEKMVVKAQGAVSIAMGARMLAESQLLTVISKSSIAQKALSAATAVSTTVFGASTTAVKLFRTALISTGIGAIAVAVGVLVANWDKLVAGFKAAADRLLNLVPGLSKVTGFFGKLIGKAKELGRQLNILPSEQEMANRKMKEQAEERLKQIDRESKQEIELVKAKGEDATELERKYLKERVDLTRTAFGEVSTEYNDALHALELFEAAQTKIMIDAAIARQGVFDEQREAALEMGRVIAEEEDSYDPEAARAKREEQRRQAELAHLEFLASMDELEDMDEEEEEDDSADLEKIREGFTREQELRHQLILDGHSAEEAAEMAHNQAMEEQREQRINALNVGLQTGEAVIGSISALSDAFAKDGKKNAKLQKTLAVAQIAIDTAKGIAGAVAAGAGVPFPGNIPAIVSGVTAVLTNIAAAKKALSQAGEGGDEGGSTPGVPTISAPTFSAPTATGGGEAGGAEAAEQAFQTAGRAYVLDSDVSSGLEAQQRINDLASL